MRALAINMALTRKRAMLSCSFFSLKKPGVCALIDPTTREPHSRHVMRPPTSDTETPAAMGSSPDRHHARFSAFMSNGRL
jgi:hypothetical protein